MANEGSAKVTDDREAYVIQPLHSKGGFLCLLFYNAILHMHSDYLYTCHAWFNDYTRCFHSLDPKLEKNIDLKLRHTARVCDNISRIAKSLHLGQEELALAEVLALLHDVGRFEQLKDYGSFDDRITTDHAALGLNVLSRAGILCTLPKNERRLVRRAIWLHNKYEIPETVSPRCLLFSRMIRDADKLDILGLIVEHFETRSKNPNPALDFGLENCPGHSHEAILDILEGRMVKIATLKNLNDMRLMYLSWVFDIYFPVTLYCIEERGYLKKLMASLPQDCEIVEAVDFIMDYLNRRGRIFI